MRLAAIASVGLAGILWVALSGVPAPSRADSHTSTCKTCGKSPKSCPDCDKGEACPHCADHGHHAHHGHHGHHGKWEGHQWEYKCVRPSKKPDEMTKQFNGLGAERWRLKEAHGGVWCFIRVKR